MSSGQSSRATQSMPNQPALGNRGHFISSIPDPLWEQAQTVAAERGESVSAAIRRALEEYVKQPKESTT
jgi:hypothetical protein